MMAPHTALMVSMLMLAGVKADDSQAFLSKFITPNLKGGTSPSMIIDDKPVLHGKPAITTKEEEKSAQKLFANGNNTPITLSAIGVGLLALVIMLGVRMQRGLRPATGGNIMEMKSHDSNMQPAVFAVTPSSIEGASRSRRTTVICAAEPEAMDLDLGEMFELFDEADPEGVKEREAAKKAEADKAAKEAAEMSMMVEGASAPFGFWDPAGLSRLGTPATQAWFRAAELKHSRVAMAACIGWIINEAGITFDGEVAKGVTFASLGKGVEAWENLPAGGKLQILLTMGAIEAASEAGKPHYMKGGRPGIIKGPFGLRLWDPLGSVSGLSDEVKATKRQMELNNGRLAMIGAASMFSATYIPGSVPALPDTW